MGRAAGLDHTGGLDADTRWYQEQMGEAPDHPSTIALDINNEMRENDLPSLRASGRVIEDNLVDDTPTPTIPRDPLMDDFYSRLREEAEEMKADNWVLQARVSLQILGQDGDTDLFR